MFTGASGLPVRKCPNLARQADAGILEILRRMPNAEAILAELAKHKTVSPPVVAPAHGAGRELVYDNNFATGKWDMTACATREMGDGSWAIRLDGQVGANAYLTRNVLGAVHGQWYTISLDVRVPPACARSVKVWANRTDGSTMDVTQ